MATQPADNTTPLDSRSNRSATTREQSEPTISEHPQYESARPDYILIQDCLDGERQIKSKGTEYLPKTSAQEDDDNQGKAYTAYKTRAVYYNYPKDTVDAAVGMLQREPAKFDQMPERMKELITSATIDNEPLHEVLADINEGQISYGGLCLLVDVPSNDGGPVPYLVKYARFAFVNWDEEVNPETGRNQLRMVTLSESDWEIQQGGQHQWVEKYRVCALDSDGNYWTAVLTPTQTQQLDTKTYDPPKDLKDKDGNDIDPYPSHSGKTLTYIPFVPINVTDLRPTPQTSPILDICDLSLSTYRGEADYRQALFMQGQATPWMTGIVKDDAPSVLGSTQLVTSQNPDAKFGFMEVEGDGLGEMRESQTDLKETIVDKGVSLTETGQTESGKALSIRTGAKTSFLNTVALTAAEGLRLALAMSASWMAGGTPDDVTKEELEVKPNLDFIEDDGEDIPKQANDLMEAKAKGLPMDMESIYQWLEKKDMVTKPWEDMQRSLETEAADVLPRTPEEEPEDDTEE
jgi:hypothetical protein